MQIGVGAMQHEPLALSRDWHRGSNITTPPSTLQQNYLWTAELSEARRFAVVCRQDSCSNRYDGWDLISLGVRKCSKLSYAPKSWSYHWTPGQRDSGTRSKASLFALSRRHWTIRRNNTRRDAAGWR
ncbi:unnamed protein product [Cercospora beticola]|nr:unnamed protein product [Cercospora beticola]